MHELDNGRLVTWVFEDGFVPSAKITGDGSYSIISDYIGTPVEAYDADGKRVWSTELDIYGRVKEFSGDVGFVPFRYQGQFHCLSSGLYYNRFRYYDPEMGQYISQDPDGLTGGNPTLDGYVRNPNWKIDPFGLMEVFRNLPLGQILSSDGLSASLPGRDMSISGHIMNGSKDTFKGSQFISTTTDINVALKNNQLGQTLVKFDTNDVISDALGNKNIIDVSTPLKAQSANLNGRPYNRALASKEVLIEGRVPANKIDIVKPDGTTTCP
jgi:RHS repeat-associated protein